MTYIDSELAKCHQNYDALSSTLNERNSELNNVITADLLSHNWQSATLKKLLKINLNLNTTLNDISRTEAAKRRLKKEKIKSEKETQKL